MGFSGPNNFICFWRQLSNNSRYFIGADIVSCFVHGCMPEYILRLLPQLGFWPASGARYSFSRFAA